MTFPSRARSSRHDVGPRERVCIESVRVSRSRGEGLDELPAENGAARNNKRPRGSSAACLNRTGRSVTTIARSFVFAPSQMRTVSPTMRSSQAWSASQTSVPSRGAASGVWNARTGKAHILQVPHERVVRFAGHERDLSQHGDEPQQEADQSLSRENASARAARPRRWIATSCRPFVRWSDDRSYCRR